MLGTRVKGDKGLADFLLAQVNIGRIVAAIDDPIMEGFVSQLDSINALAEASPGFVWRLKDEESGNATGLTVNEDPRVIVNMSVWEDVESLADYVYRSAHVKVMAGRRAWFERWDGPFMALWWVPSDHRPTIEEALERLRLLARHGPTPQAFTFKQRFAPPDAGSAVQPHDDLDDCPSAH